MALGNPISRCMTVRGDDAVIQRYLISWIGLGPASSRYLFVGLEQQQLKTLKAQLGKAANRIEFLSYPDLTINNARIARGRAVILFSPELALHDSQFGGRVDAGIVRVLGSGIWKRLMIVRAATEFSVRGYENWQRLADADNGNIELRPTSMWLRDFLTVLLYRRHSTLNETLRNVKLSAWWRMGDRSEESVKEALTDLLRMRIVRQRKSRYSCTEYGRLVVDEDIPFEKYDVKEVATRLEARRIGEREENFVPEIPEDYLREMLLEILEEETWANFSNIVSSIQARNPDIKVPKATVRRLLEKMQQENVFSSAVYNRGVGRPARIYFNRGIQMDWLENRCRGCAFYVMSVRRCSLWWALNRFSGNDVQAKWSQLSKISHEKVRYGTTSMGPNAMSCEHYSPKKKDFPLTNAVGSCSGCGAGIQFPVAKLVQCTTCGTTYKPTLNRILVLYNHRQLFRQKFSEISGHEPPLGAMELSRGVDDVQERDILVLYPDERVRLSKDGMRIERKDAETFERYNRVLRVIDYGALSRTRISLLRKNGVEVTTRTSVSPAPIAEGSIVAEKMGRMRETGEVSCAISEALVVSVIIATKRILEFKASSLWMEPLEAQLIEYARMKRDKALTVDSLLAFEARISYHYWKAYKSRLKYAGLDFRSRVRDRLVRELVQNARARARGYSPANSAINYLHQRRIAICKRVNEVVGLPATEGLLHVAKRRYGLGLLLDLSDAFKLADREKFFEACIRFQVRREDFVSKLGRQGVRFYYPTAAMIDKLEKMASEADNLVMRHHGTDFLLMEAYREMARSFRDAIEKTDTNLFVPFVYGTQADKEWFDGKFSAIRAKYYLV